MAAGRTDVMALTTPATQRRRRRGAVRPVTDWTRAGLFGRLSGVDRIFTLEQARRLMPDLLARADDVVAARADLVELQTALNQGMASPLGGLPEVKALEARLAQGKNEHVSPYEIATLYASLGDKDGAFRWLDVAYRDRDLGLMRLNSDFLLDPIRSDERLAELVRKVGLPRH